MKFLKNEIETKDKMINDILGKILKNNFIKFFTDL
jgi:hypothetical protein